MTIIYRRFLFTVITLLAMTATGMAQSLLDRPVTIEAKKRPVKEVLAAIGKRAGFSFSYNSTILHEDSLVTISAANKPVLQVLHMIYGDQYQYKEIDNHVIIHLAEKEKWYTISGYVRDALTGEKISDASVFDRQQLTSTLTNDDGHFRLRIKDKGRYTSAGITVSKGGFYIDTSLSMPAGYDQDLTISLTPSVHALPDIFVTQYDDMERSWFGKLLFSSKLRKQSANLGKFFTDKPVQASVIPGIGTHGHLSSQVTNKFSFNLLGGYSAGVDGFELGGLFNIDKKDVKYVQVGGIFNIVSGNATGVQIGGVANKVSGTVKGVQISGVASHTRHHIEGVIITGVSSRAGGSMKGLQISGISNILDNHDTIPGRPIDTVVIMKGMQLSGVANVVNGNSNGMQLAGVCNINHGDMKGVQLSGVCNIAKDMKGVQIGLINIADTISGYSIGILNIVKKGYHALAISGNELLTFNAAYKTGNKKLYSSITIGGNLTEGSKAFAYGCGIGTERRLSAKTGLSVEAIVMHLYKGNANTALLTRLETSFNWNISRKFTLFTGPSVSLLPVLPGPAATGYLPGIPGAALHTFPLPFNGAAWAGWQVGFHIF